jgi:enoyl-CoA hydratase/carnithine racemase
LAGDVYYVFFYKLTALRKYSIFNRNIRIKAPGYYTVHEEVRALDYETIEYRELEPGIGEIALNRPRRYNAVNFQMMEELEHFWGQRQHDLGTHVLILSGNGEKGFCAGLDMREAIKRYSDMDPDHVYAFQTRLARMIVAMRRVPQPIVCAVHGPAVGLGFSFALASDIRVVSPDARFSAAYINIGLGGADMACSYFLPRMIGAGRAYEIMLTGDFLPAREAMQLGMISRLVARSELTPTALELAQTLNSKNPMGLRLTKEAINMSLDAGGLEQVISLEDRNQAILVGRGMLGRNEKTSKYF